MFPSGHLKASQELMARNKTPAFRYDPLNVNFFEEEPQIT
jgi:hypothetical protein